MLTRGEYKNKTDSYGVIISYTRQEAEVILVSAGQVCSAFKTNSTGDFSFISNKAKDLWNTISNGIRSCSNKNGTAVPFVYGTSVIHNFSKSKVDYAIERFNGDLCGAEISGEDLYVYLKFTEETSIMPQNIPYIQLTKVSSEIQVTDDVNSVVVRSVAEIALEKEDITWLKNKKYYIVNDDEQAEKIFSFLDNYNGVIAYDTETTGLRINCFGKINSDYQRQLIQWNKEHPNEQCRADRLVGIIFCIENDVSYYFPVFNRRFKNLYDDKSSRTREAIINNTKARYTIGDLRDSRGDMRDYVRKTPADEWSSDVILMERVRNIIQTKHIVAHNGAFEWKVGWQYEIDTGLRDDTMIMHQIMYKFRSTTSNRGESSSLKYLAKRELGIDQWELSDFFPDFKEDKGGEVRTKAGGKGKGKSKYNSKIDFSYMTYEGTKVYAPTDGDVTLQLFMKYKRDMLENHREQEYIYNVEIIVACCIGYMEFYGHRLDENKIAAVRDKSKAELVLLESKIRQLVHYASNEELTAYAKLSDVLKQQESAEKEGHKDLESQLHDEVIGLCAVLSKTIADNKEHELNLGSPAQVCKLFYEELKIPFNGDKQSVAKKEVNTLLKARNEDGSDKYPVVHLYSSYKKIDTLLTKFFDNLPYFMYPGGLIFSSFGQISTATGRMSCSKPNAQQYPKAVTAIVVPRSGYVMMDADYSQIEYRVLTALAGNDELAKLFADPDSDYHTLMASMMYDVPYASVTPEMRGDAKKFNFGIPYGMGFKSLAILITGMCGQSQVDEAKEKYELYFKNQPKTRKFFDQIKEMAQVNRYTKTFWNRYRYYSFEDKDGTTNSGKKAAALRQAGNAVIQGTAADIFKISVARNFTYIRQNGLLGLLLIVNMIHDEQLFEVNANKLNIQRVLRDVGQNMQFKVQGFPPLFIGAGLGPNWAKSKGKMTEIHPHLLDIFTEEAENMPLWADKPHDPKEILDYFASRVYQFRRDKVREYLLNPENHGKALHPAIGNLLNLQFNYGHNKDKEHLSDAELTNICLQGFIDENNLNVSTDMFMTQSEQSVDAEEDAEYSDGEDEEELDPDEYSDSDFALIDEKDVAYGSSVHDIIRTFGCMVSKQLKLCGIDTRMLDRKKKDSLADFLYEHVCESSEDGALEVVFLQDTNILFRTGIWVKGIDGSEVEKRIKLMHIA